MAKNVSDTWERGDPYERYVGRWSRQVAPQFLSWLRIPSGRRWLDVGCGTGALAAAILDQCAPASVAALEPSPGFRETAQRNLAHRATPALIERLMPAGYEATPERAIIFTVKAWEANCPRHIPRLLPSA